MYRKRDWTRPIATLVARSWQLLRGVSTWNGRIGALEAGPVASDIDDARSDVEASHPLPFPSGERSTPSDWGPSETDVEPTATDGVVSVHDGQVHITHPVSGGLLPVIIPGSDVILSIDGQEVVHPVSVWAGQRVTVSPRLTGEPVRSFEIRVDRDGMAAWLVLPAMGSPGYRVADAGPSHVISLWAEALPGLQVNPSLEEVGQAMLAAGVVIGIDHSAIARALDRTDAVMVQVAAGKPAVPGQPGRVEMTVEDVTAADADNLGVRVQQGQSLARVVPPQFGEVGYNVMGQILEVERQANPRLTAGFGAMLVRNGTEAVAAIAGRPGLLELEPGLFQAVVAPVTELPGPLSQGPTPYRFEGDVVIQGDVHDGVTIQASGWIWVSGTVQGAVLQAGQGIRVDGTIQRSRLITKSARSILQTLLRRFERILGDLDQMHRYATEITNHPRYAELSRTKSLGEVMLLLAQNRFGHFRQWIQESRHMITDLSFLNVQVDLEAVLNTLEQRLYSGNVNSVNDLSQIIDGIGAACQRLKESMSVGIADAPVRVQTLIWSEVDSDGEVVVLGAGTERTTVRARGHVHGTTLRDSHVTSETAIEMGVVVASEPAKTVLEVAPGGHISASLVAKPVQLRIGEWHHQLDPASQGVFVDSDPSGRVTVTSGPQPKNGQAAPLPVPAYGAYHPS